MIDASELHTAIKDLAEVDLDPEQMAEVVNAATSAIRGKVQEIAEEQFRQGLVICLNCKKFTTSQLVDFGVGTNEAWGSSKRDVQPRAVTKCCEAPYKTEI